MTLRPGGLLGHTLRAVEIAEDAIHVVVAILLTALGITDHRHRAPHRTCLGRPLQPAGDRDPGSRGTLLLFIVAELLHTVAIAIQHRGAPDPEPFLVVGLVAGIRRVLILTAEAEQSFRWNPPGIELLILMALILVMAITTLVWRRSIRLRGNETSVTAPSPARKGQR
jgi:hypothetical protein